jgi:drug/metabolite transporter (DMT)-like permease
VGLVALNGYLLVSGQIRLYGEAPMGIQGNLLIAGALSAAALISLTKALNLTTVASATTLNSLQVAIAPVIAWLFLDEKLTLLAAGGILTVLMGVIIVQRGRVAAQQDREGDG